jgi:hypothetical protein
MWLLAAMREWTALSSDGRMDGRRQGASDAYSVQLESPERKQTEHSATIRMKSHWQSDILPLEPQCLHNIRPPLPSLRFPSWSIHVYFLTLGLEKLKTGNPSAGLYSIFKCPLYRPIVLTLASRLIFELFADTAPKTVEKYVLLLIYFLPSISS